jgi:hypothetical protein
MNPAIRTRRRNRRRLREESASSSVLKTITSLILAGLGFALVSQGIDGISSSRPEFLEEYRGSSSFDPVSHEPISWRKP